MRSWPLSLLVLASCSSCGAAPPESASSSGEQIATGEEREPSAQPSFVEVEGCDGYVSLDAVCERWLPAGRECHSEEVPVTGEADLTIAEAQIVLTSRDSDDEGSYVSSGTLVVRIGARWWPVFRGEVYAEVRGADMGSGQIELSQIPAGLLVSHRYSGQDLDRGERVWNDARVLLIAVAGDRPLRRFAQVTRRSEVYSEVTGEEGVGSSYFLPIEWPGADEVVLGPERTSYDEEAADQEIFEPEMVGQHLEAGRVALPDCAARACEPICLGPPS